MNVLPEECLGTRNNSYYYYIFGVSPAVGAYPLKGLAQAKIIKKSVILFWLLNMTI